MGASKLKVEGKAATTIHALLVTIFKNEKKTEKNCSVACVVSRWPENSCSAYTICNLEKRIVVPPKKRHSRHYALLPPLARSPEWTTTVKTTTRCLAGKTGVPDQ